MDRLPERPAGDNQAKRMGDAQDGEGRWGSNFSKVSGDAGMVLGQEKTLSEAWEGQLAAVRD